MFLGDFLSTWAAQTPHRGPKNLLGGEVTASIWVVKQQKRTEMDSLIGKLPQKCVQRPKTKGYHLDRFYSIISTH